MPFLKQQLQIINNALLATSLADKRFATGRFETEAEDVVRKDKDGKIEVFPAIMSENYEAQEITVNDTYPIIIYHKPQTKSYQANKQADFGDRNKGIVETTTIKMIVYAKFSVVKLSRDQLESLITANFPDQIQRASYAELGLDNMTVILQSSNLNSMAVWQEEYKNIEFALAPEDVYFSITYQIQNTFRKGCFSICDCPVYLLTEDSQRINANGHSIRV